MVKVGDIVKVNVLKYKNFRGAVTEIKNNVATIEVPTYYGAKEPVVLYRDVRFLRKSPETLKELEDQKKEEKLNGSN